MAVPRGSAPWIPLQGPAGWSGRRQMRAAAVRSASPEAGRQGDPGSATAAGRRVMAEQRTVAVLGAGGTGYRMENASAPPRHAMPMTIQVT